jgi:predicted O-linked N-acetylglucosamine transferase (SPINDLY family)
MTQLSLEQLWQQAIQSHRAGNLAAAEKFCRQIISLQPQHADALHLLGVIALQSLQANQAANFFRQAIAARPSFASALANLGNALSAQNLFDDAIAAYRQAIAANPKMPEAHFALGNALTAKKDFDAALAAYRQAIALKHDYAKAHYNLGTLLKERGQNPAAVAAFRSAATHNPNFAEAHYNLGMLLRAAGELDESIAAYRKAAALQPQRAVYICNMGVALLEAGKLDDAAAAFRQSIALDPKLADFHFNLGTVLLAQRNVDGAADAFRRAIALDPKMAEAHNNLASALNRQRRLDEGFAELRIAVELAPDDAAIASNLLFMLEFHPAYTAAKILEEARAWNRRYAEPLSREILPHENDRNPNRPLRIGYVSPDFWDHCQSLFMEPLLKNHDRSGFEIFCYAHVAHPDEVTARLKKLPQVWRDTLGQSDADLARRIRSDKIDILVDLTMHMNHNRALLFARKPAPIQVCYLAYPGTTGMTAVDYRFTDPYLDPIGKNDSLYAEKTIHLPETFWCYEPAVGRGLAVTPLPALANGFIRFGCLSNIFKICDPALHLWSQVLRAVPNSRLLLRAPHGSTRENMLRIFEQNGIARPRIEFVVDQTRKKYLEEYNRIDIGLDCFPANGHTTSLDSFWMGVPVVTKVGVTVADRAGYCQLMNLNLPELIANTPEEYIDIARNLAADLPRLAVLRSGLRHRMEQSPLMNAARFTRHIEAAYRKMWKSWIG